MMRHLTYEPNTATSTAFDNAAQQKQNDAESELSSHCDNTDPTLSSGSDTSEAMHTRRARIGPTRHPLLAQASSAADSTDSHSLPRTNQQ